MAMTLRSGGLIQDENHNVQYNGPSVAGKANAINSQRKSGRKPLGDLSNSKKPVLNHPSKWQTTTNFTISDDESGAGKKKSIQKGPERVQKGSRKVLSDISNSGKPYLHEASKKKQNLKLSTVREEPLQLDSICEERFLHNHQVCMKAQNFAVDKDHFLSIVGLDHPRELTFTKKPVSPLKHSEVDEMVVDEMVEWAVDDDQSPKNLRLFGRGRLDDRSPHCKSPKSPSLNPFSLWKKDSDNINFTLINTP